MKQIPIFVVFILIIACKHNINENDKYRVCNDLLENCTSSNADYCLLGYKWGNSSYFSPAGANVSGPKVAGGNVTFSFQESNGLVNTHSQIDLPSESFVQLISCSKSEIIRALATWESIANISFTELPENSDTDIRFFVADINNTGVGYPNFPDEPCIQIGGDIVIQSGANIDNCDSFYIFILHEIGHTLGLGHVSTKNVMNPNFYNQGYTGLQNGDIQGIQEIYGEK